jgi:hypothetical protein
VQDVSTH